MIEWNKVTWYSKLVAVFVFLCVFALGILLGSAYEKTKNPNLFVDDHHDTNSAPVVNEPVKTFPLSTSTIFTSEKLGIRFSHLSYDQQFDQRFSIKEEGNKLFISFDSQPESSLHEFITVFNKTSGESFMQAVERIAFSGSIPKGCSIGVPKFMPIQNGYQVLELQSESNVEADRDKTQCSQSTYNSDWRSAYFLYNPQVPTKVLFVNNGQDAFPSVPWTPGEINSNNPSAAETIEILK